MAGIDWYEVLKVYDLRAGFLKYTRAAYALLPAYERPHILDIGCGSGLPTLELARLSGGEVVALDVDGSELAKLRRRVEQAGLARQIQIVNASFYDSSLRDGSFEVLWGEGALRFLEPGRSFPECRRLLAPGGFLVINETIAWLEEVAGRLEAGGFRLWDRYVLPAGSWWTEYYAPLEANIRAARAAYGDAADDAAPAQFEREIAMVKADPARFDCAYYLWRKDA